MLSTSLQSWSLRAAVNASKLASSTTSGTWENSIAAGISSGPWSGAPSGASGSTGTTSGNEWAVVLAEEEATVEIVGSFLSFLRFFSFSHSATTPWISFGSPLDPCFGPFMEICSSRLSKLTNLNFVDSYIWVWICVHKIKSWGKNAPR